MHLPGNNKKIKISVRNFFLLAAIGITTIGYTQNKAVVDYFSVAAITFNNTAYHLSWSSHPSADYYKQEYLPAGEDANKFKSMLLVEVITGDQQPKDLAAAKMEELRKMKEANPVINYESFSNPSTGEYMIDFLLTANSADGNISIAERNVYRYKRFTNSAGQKGVQLFAISTRAYTTAADKFIAGLKNSRMDMINKVSQFKIPAITLKK